MKFQTSLTALAFVATSQLVFAQGAPQVNDDTVAVQTIDSAAPAAQTDLPDIYWWKTLLNDDEISRYLPEPAQTVGATDAAVPTAAPSVTDPVAATSVSDAAGAASSVSAASDVSASASVSDASVTGMSAAATEASSTGASSAWSSSSGSAASPAVATSAISQSIAVPKPSGGSIPPATSSNAVNHTSKATQVTSEMSRVLFSVAAISAALLKFLS